MNTVTNEFASRVLDDKVMKETLSDDVYAALKKTIDEGENLSFDVANAVAVAMKDCSRKRRDAFHALVPAAYRRYRRKTRRIYRTVARRQSHHGVFGQGTY